MTIVYFFSTSPCKGFGIIIQAPFSSVADNITISSHEILSACVACEIWFSSMRTGQSQLLRQCPMFPSFSCLGVLIDHLQVSFLFKVDMLLAYHTLADTVIFTDGEGALHSRFLGLSFPVVYGCFLLESSRHNCQ